MSYRYLNIHVLISHSPSCLNRDDMNMQKSAIFGGARRVRISSQSLKRAMRTSSYYQENLGQPALRTKKLARLKNKVEQALNGQFDANLLDRAIAYLTGKDGLPDSDTVAPYSIQEIAKVCEIIQKSESEGLEAKAIEKNIQKSYAGPIGEALGKTVDIALSGRMTTSGLMSTVEGAMSLAHTITTHEVDADVDWFTAVDDLMQTEEETERGAAHLGTQEFGSGTFYRYASINLELLQKNLGHVSREEALKVASHAVHLLATVVPEAKQHTFAAHNLADLVFVSFGDIPVSGANAFEQAIKRDTRKGFIRPSIQAFEAYMEKVRTGYGLSESHAAFSLWETELSPRKKSLEDLKQWICLDAQQEN